MNRNFKLLIIIFSLSLMLFGCSNKKADSIDKENKKEDEKEVIKEVITPFSDDNPIKVGFYEYTNSGRNLLTEYNAPWILRKDIGVFTVFPTNDTTISNNYAQYTWKEHWDKYSDVNDYKIGYFIRFKLTNGEIIEQTILKPSDGMKISNYLLLYLYDDIHQPIGAWYRHLEDNEVKDDTLFTSIKIYAYELGKLDEIVSPIQLTVFTYDGKGDFDFNTNMYLGTSRYTININKSN